MTEGTQALAPAERRRLLARLLRWMGISDVLGGLALALAAAPLRAEGASFFGRDAELNGLVMILGGGLAVMGLALWVSGRYMGRASLGTANSESVVQRR